MALFTSNREPVVKDRCKKICSFSGVVGARESQSSFDVPISPKRESSHWRGVSNTSWLKYTLFMALIIENNDEFRPILHVSTFRSLSSVNSKQHKQERYQS